MTRNQLNTLADSWKKRALAAERDLKALKARYSTVDELVRTYNKRKDLGLYPEAYALKDDIFKAAININES